MNKILLLLFLFTINFDLNAQSKPPTDSLRVRLKASYIVDKNGDIKDVKIIESDCKQCDKKTLKAAEQEALNVIKSTPNTGPKIDKSGRPIAARFIMPLTIVIAPDSTSTPNRLK